MNTPNTKPFVTVIIPCFNTALYLAATLKSVQAQTFRDFEVIMVDDGSTDGTLSIMQEFAARNERCEVISLQQNQGIVAARNAALAQACGECIAMLDGDDIWTPDALAVRVELAQYHPSADVIATEFAWFEDKVPARPIGRVGLGPHAKRAFASSYATNEPTLLRQPFNLVANLHFAWTSATLVRRAAMSAIGNFDPTFKGPEDTLLWLRLAQRGAFLFAPQLTAFYRQRPGSLVTLQKGPKELHYLKVLDWVRKKPEFAPHASVIRRLTAECHHVCVQHYRRTGDSATACSHALGAIKNQPQAWSYWRDLAAASLDAVRNRPQKPINNSRLP